MTASHRGRADGAGTASRRERGLMLVETAMVVPLFLVLLFGVADYGLAWRDKMLVETATRSGARTAANLGAERMADYNLLQSVEAALRRVPDADIEYIVVFNASTSAAVPTACAAGTSQAGICNVYTPAAFDLPMSSFTGTTTCASPSPDRYWCPTARSQGAGGTSADYLGLYIKVKRPHVAKLLAGDIRISSVAVMRLDP